jgi:hypothetical protein
MTMMGHSLFRPGVVLGRSMEKIKRARKPKDLMSAGVYAVFNEGDDCCVYVGGSYYFSSGEIHLSEEEVYTLAKYLSKASEYLKDKNK